MDYAQHMNSPNLIEYLSKGIEIHSGAGPIRQIHSRLYLILADALLYS